MSLVLTDRNELDAALRAIGVDPATVSDRIFAPCDPEPESKCTVPLDVELSDGEWDLIAPHLPPEPTQSATLSNREIVDAVLRVIVLRKPWTGLGGARAEAVRKKFGRWVRAGAWQRLAAALSESHLSPERKRQILRIAERANAQQRKMRSVPRPS
jgi:transposase